MRNGVDVTQFDIRWRSARIIYSHKYRLYRTSANSYNDITKRSYAMVSTTRKRLERLWRAKFNKLYSLSKRRYKIISLLLSQ